MNETCRITRIGHFYWNLATDALELQGDDNSLYGYAPSQYFRTMREWREKFRLIGLGLGASEIAAKLSRGVKIIEAHRANLKQKRGKRNAHELNRFAANWADREWV